MVDHCAIRICLAQICMYGTCGVHFDITPDFTLKLNHCTIIRHSNNLLLCVFLQHILPKDSFKIVPILCGNLQMTLSEYSRRAYREKAGSFLEAVKDILKHHRDETLLVAGVDLSHIGPKFGHEMPAQYMKGQSEAHDRALLNTLSALDADSFWKESGKVKDQYNVCGFAALACLLEVLPPCKGYLLGYEMWHEEATRSAVSYAAVAFAEQKQL